MKIIYYKRIVVKNISTLNQKVKNSLNVFIHNKIIKSMIKKGQMPEIAVMTCGKCQSLLTTSKIIYICDIKSLKHIQEMN